MTDPMELVGRLESGSDRFPKWAYKEAYSGAPVISIPRHPDNIDALLIEAAACIREMVEWRPIETAPRDGTIIQRPHTTWGAMSVRHKRPDQSEEFLHGFSWMAADYSVLWPESAFLPFWLPIPPAPGAEA
ncbi:hypothetical protein [uncultured Hyphomicrobium sp.]|uniref:hypothetical protein n=1 Tax=uncultured Hyphomicrobium sp. TaxID=194373 RepID=UPI0025D930F2|nr:hypothetical protein [uncultured Hyphomicrobium sp.]